MEANQFVSVSEKCEPSESVRQHLLSRQKAEIVSECSAEERGVLESQIISQ